METTRPRRAAALLLVAALLLAATFLLAAAPAAAAPPEGGGGAAWSPQTLVDAMTAWLAALWPGADPSEAPDAAWGAADAGTTPSTEPPVVPNGEITADPERGSTIDPGG